MLKTVRAASDASSMDRTGSLSRRPLLIVRGVLLATAVVLALAAYGLRAGPDSPASVQLNGRTSQGFPIWATAGAGQVKALFVPWHSTSCSPGAHWGTVNVFKEPDYRFHRSGRRFTTSEEHTGPAATRGSSPGAELFTPARVALVTTRVSGELAADGHSAAGSIRGHVAWMENGQPVAWCDTGSVRWHVSH